MGRDGVATPPHMRSRRVVCEPRVVPHLPERERERYVGVYVSVNRSPSVETHITRKSAVTSYVPLRVAHHMQKILAPCWLGSLTCCELTVCGA